MQMTRVLSALGPELSQPSRLRVRTPASLMSGQTGQEESGPAQRLASCSVHPGHSPPLPAVFSHNGKAGTPTPAKGAPTPRKGALGGRHFSSVLGGSAAGPCIPLVIDGVVFGGIWKRLRPQPPDPSRPGAPLGRWGKQGDSGRSA